MALPARANVRGSPMLHSYIGCCSVQSMASDPATRGLDMRGGATLEGKQLLLSRQVRWSPEDRQQNGQAGRKRWPEASKPGVLESSQAVSQASPFVPPLGHILLLSLPSLCLLSGLARALLHCLWRSSDAPLWVMGLPPKMGSQGKLLVKLLGPSQLCSRGSQAGLLGERVLPPSL